MRLASPTTAFSALLLAATLAGPRPAAARMDKGDVNLGKIIGGSEAKKKEFPYILSLELWGHHICGASALNTRWAVTAAHCVTDVESDDLVVLRAGSLRREAGGHVHCVVRVLWHPRYGDNWYDHDIALLQVARPFRSGGYVSFLRLSEVADWPPGTRAVVAGWGVTRVIHNLQADGVDISFSNRLKKVEVQVVGNEVCRKKPVFFMRYPITSRMMCAISDGKDSTQGDSGGPLVVKEQNWTSLVGIVSCGEGRGHVDSPGVYTRVVSFTKWIYSHIKSRRQETRNARVLHLNCGRSTFPWGDYATHKVHVIPYRMRRNRRQRRVHRQVP